MQLKEMAAPESSPDALSAAAIGGAIDLCAAQLASRYDAKDGGFGGACTEREAVYSCRRLC